MPIGITKAETQVDNESSVPGAEGHFLQSDGSVKLEADLRADSHKIVGLLDPTADQDAATKNYVDVQLATKTAIIQFEFSSDIRVPGSGTLFLSVGSVPTSAVPVFLNRDITFFGATIRVDQADSSNDYDLRFLINGSVVEFLPLLNGSASDSTLAFTATASAGDELSVQLFRTAGGGKSDFRSVIVILQTLDA